MTLKQKYKLLKSLLLKLIDLVNSQQTMDADVMG